MDSKSWFPSYMRQTNLSGNDEITNFSEQSLMSLAFNTRAANRANERQGYQMCIKLTKAFLKNVSEHFPNEIEDSFYLNSPKFPGRLLKNSLANEINHMVAVIKTSTYFYCFDLTADQFVKIPDSFQNGVLMFRVESTSIEDLKNAVCENIASVQWDMGRFSVEQES